MAFELRILTIIGTRPQFIKAAAISSAINQFNKQSNSSIKITEEIVNTGQHYDVSMSNVFIEKLGLPTPKYNLNINNLPHGEMTANMLIKIERLLSKKKPDYIIIYGDTNSTLSAALAACKTDVRIVHIEAGLRSDNLKMPEELNRILSDRISDLLFCSSEAGYENLTNKENFPHKTKHNEKQKIFVVGDVMIDSICLFKRYFESIRLEKFGITQSPFILTTIHREQITGEAEKLGNIIEALNKLSSQFQIVFPLHPRTKKCLETFRIRLPKHFLILEPQPYFEMQCLISKADFVVTDSGGVQKEAYFLGTPCITTREETEWTETVRNGMNTLTGFNSTKIVNAVGNFIKPNVYDKNIFGDGKAAKRIIQKIYEHHLQTKKPIQNC